MAWATERRDVLSGLFFLLTLLTYLHASARRAASRWRWLAASIGCYVAALLSKAAVVPLPVLLLVLDVYPLRRLRWPPRTWIAGPQRTVLIEKLPFLALGLGFGMVALHTQASLITPLQHSLPLRLELALSSLGFYVWKTVVPLSLSPLYELASRVDPLAWRYVLSAVAAVALAAAVAIKDPYFVLGPVVLLAAGRQGWRRVLQSALVGLLAYALLSGALTGPAVATTWVGRPGTTTLPGTTRFDAADSGPTPRSLVARTVNV